MLDRRSQKRQDSSAFKIISWRHIFPLLLLSVGSAVLAGIVLLHIAALAPTKQSELEIEALKTSLTIAAGATGLGALLLAVRRQWLSERAQLRAEYDTLTSQEHARNIAADNRLDATERRITELYGKSAELLGSPHPPVILAGIYALERLGQTYREHRWSIIELLCGYVRLSDPSRNQQLDACVSAALAVIARHARDESGEQYWGAPRIDLSGAFLPALNFDGCTMAAADFTGARFQGDADFSACHFSGRAIFAQVTFEAASDFTGARFGKRAYFEGARFTGHAHFSSITAGANSRTSTARVTSPCMEQPSIQNRTCR